MDDFYIESILAECSSEQYPQDFLNENEALECLSHNDTSTTLLVKNKETKDRFVAKCYLDKTLLSDITEADILRTLSHPRLPHFAGAYENEHMLCVVREYVEGTPLDQYTIKNTPNEKQAVAICEELCDILFYLHSRTPPVIHRDIKPQNLIVDKDGMLHLIDFGISRTYDASSAEDTVCYGTRYFAAPEQYGFAQTDMRSDIFSLGVLLGWLLTGEVELDRILPKIENRWLLRVVKKCTAFAPDMRFKSIEKVKRALNHADGQRRKRVIRWTCALAACAACLCVGFGVGRYTNLVLIPQFGVQFEEPLIEEAVRLMLNKNDDELISKTDLLNVTEIYICGDQVAADNSAFEKLAEHFANNDGMVKNGGISSLEDLAELKNLKIIHIMLQDIADLTPLSSLEALQFINLGQNPIEDVSPLGSLPVLNNLCLYETRLSDLSSLTSCGMLTCIDVGKTQIASMEAFDTLENIRELYMADTPLQTLAEIERLSRLEKISLTNVSDGDLRPLLEMPLLIEVNLDESLRQIAEKQLNEAAFSIIYS